MSISPTQSLVKYDNPVQVTGKDKKLKASKSQSVTGKGTINNNGSPTTKVAKLPAIDNKTSTLNSSALNTSNAQQTTSQTEDILNSIIPPKEWTEEGQVWVQKVSSTPATRVDVINLQEMLDQKLSQRQARETGICPIRQELYGQCFDEIIRQVTINCAERGLLLLRVRDELKMTQDAYQTLYESSIAFGMRKALEAEQGKADMETRINQLEEDKKDLERQVAELKSKAEFIEKRENERRAQEERKHQEEVQFLKRTNIQLKTQLESILKKN